MAPTAPSQSMAEPVSDVGDASGEKYLRKGKIQRGHEGRREKVRDGPVSSMVREEGGGKKRWSRCWSRRSLEAPRGVPARADIHAWD